MFVSAIKLDIITRGLMGTDMLLEPASSGQSRNCKFWYLTVVGRMLGCTKF